MPTDVPDNVNEDGTFMLDGKFLNTILAILRENQISLEDENGPLQIREVGPQGTVLGLDTTEC